MYRHAIVREPGTNLAQGLTTAGLGPPDPALALRQHADYVEALRALGLQVTVLEAAPDYPDGCFVEDTAVVTSEVAVIARPGAPSRRGETASIAPLLARHRPVERIEAPGTLDGGDVLIVDRHAFIGLSARTNRAGGEQLGRILEARGYRWTLVPVGDGLHLKSGVNAIGPGALLITEAFAGREVLSPYEQVVVDEDESYAVNAVWVNGALLVAGGFPKTRTKLLARGLRVVELDAGEMRKMDGGLTCLSLRF